MCDRWCCSFPTIYVSNKNQEEGSENGSTLESLLCIPERPAGAFDAAQMRT